MASEQSGSGFSVWILTAGEEMKEIIPAVPEFAVAEAFYGVAAAQNPGKTVLLRAGEQIVARSDRG